MLDTDISVQNYAAVDEVLIRPRGGCLLMPWSPHWKNQGKPAALNGPGLGVLNNWFRIKSRGTSLSSHVALWWGLSDGR